MSRRLKTLPGMISSWCFSMARVTNSVAGAPGGFGEGVKRPAGLHQFVVVGQAGDEQVALAAVGVDVRRHVDVQRHGARPLHRLRGADETVLLQLDHLVDDRRRPVGEAQPPAGHRRRSC